MTRKPPNKPAPVPVLLHWRDAVAMAGAIDPTIAIPASAISVSLLMAEDAESITIVQTQFINDGECHESLTVPKGMLRSLTYLEAGEKIEFKVKVTRKKAAKKKRKGKK